MINSFKPFVIDANDIINLKNINPFWNKELQKKIKKLNKWLIKFNKKSLDFGIEFTSNYDQYQKMITQIDHYKSFVNQKYDLIKSAPKILAKFQKLIHDYCATLGIIKAIELFCSYYKFLETNDVESRKYFMIDLANQIIKNFLKILKSDITKIFGQDSYVDLCFDNIVQTDRELINSFVFLNNILKYSGMLYKKKRLTEKEFINVNAVLVEYYAFINEFILTSMVLIKDL